MKKADANKLALGLYEIFWKSGGSSLASVGYNAAGDRWFAPTNWISVPSFDWRGVDCVKLLRTRTSTGSD